MVSVSSKGIETSVFDVQKINPEPPQKSLVPTGLRLPGGQLYSSPSGPVEPWDCDRFPSSPMCGGNPLSKDFLNLDFKIVADECNLGIDVQGTTGFISGPNHQLVFRKQECIDFKPAEELPPPPSISKRLKLPDLDPEKEYLIALEVSSSNGKYGKVIDLNCSRVGYGIANVKQTFSTAAVYQTGEYPILLPAYLMPTVPLYCAIYNIDIYSLGQKSGADAPALGRIRGTKDIGGPVHLFSGLGRLLKLFFTGECQHNHMEINQGSPSPLYVLVKPPAIYESFSSGGQEPTIINTTIERIVDLKTCIKVFPLPPRLILPPPPPPPDRCECEDMGCCPQPANNNDQLLKLILKRLGDFPVNVEIYDSDENQADAQKQTLSIPSVSSGIRTTVSRIEKNSKITGMAAFPIEVPDSLIDKPSEGVLGAVWDFIVPNKTRKLTNLAELIAWQTEQFSNVFGDWMQVIKIKDANAVEKGDQSKKIVVPNMSHAFKEILVLLVQISKILGLNLDVSLKNLTETSGTKLAAAKAYLVAKDIQEYLDYPTKEKAFDVPLQISSMIVTQPTDPGGNASEAEKKKFEEAKKKADEDANDLHKYLQPSNAKIKVDDWTGELSLQDQLNDLEQGNAMIRAEKFVKD